MKPAKNIYIQLLKLAAASFFLSFLLNFQYPANRYLSWKLLQPSVDIWLLLAFPALVACCTRYSKAVLFFTCLPVWTLFLGLRLFRIGDTAVPMYLNRPFNLYIDSGYLFGLYDLLKTSSRQGEFLLMSALTVAAALAIMISGWYAWQAAARLFWDGRLRRFFLIGSGLALLGLGLIRGWQSVQPPVIARLATEIISIGHQLKDQRLAAARFKKIAGQRSGAAVSLKGLDHADVLLFVVESYGHVVFNESRYRPAMEATMERFAGVLDRHGFKAVSSYLDSPTYGGASWLAHTSLEFGVRVKNHLEDQALLRSSLPPLASYFGRSGYRTVSVMPGTRYAFPEGSAFGYDQFYYAHHFNYRGPKFGWAPMADQFVLDWVRRHEFEKRKGPLFVRYELVSSHASFSVQPPFIADWQKIGDGSIYNDLQLIRYPIHWPNLKNAGEAYLRSLDYEFTLLGDYLARYVDTDSLIIILGDHQPNLQLTGGGQPWSVPVHIISRNIRLLQPFVQRGYKPGLIPDQPPPHAKMKTFLPDFLDDFAG